LRELWLPFLFGVAIFTFVFILDKVFQLTDLIITKRVVPSLSLLLFLYYLPATLTITLPMGTLVANLSTFGRLSSDGEIVAIQTGGVSLKAIITPALAIGLLLSIVGVVFNETILPRANHAFRTLYSTILYQHPEVQLEEGTFLRFGSYQIYIGKITEDKLKRIYVFQGKSTIGGRVIPSRTIFAREARWRRSADSLYLHLNDGSIHFADPKNPKKYHLLKFDKHMVKFNLVERSYRQSKGIREMNSMELLKKIVEYRKEKFNVNFLLVELYKRQSIPFACLTFSLIGIPLGLLTKRGGKMIGFGLSIPFIFSYYLMLITGEVLAKKGFFIPLLSVWMPNIIFGGIGILLLLRIKK
jgi:LPS export ABC transporter permease LptF